LIVFNEIFYFMKQILPFYMISIFTIITKINFCILLFDEFYVFGKWNKSSFKILQKNYFFNLKSLWDDMKNKWICRILLEFLIAFNGKFYFIHQIHSFYTISIFSQIQKLIFIFYFSINFMFLENVIKVC
jgi:hypothetical protein